MDLQDNRGTHLALVGDEAAVDALVAVVGLRDRCSWRRLEMPASLVPVNEELDLPYLELLEKLCFIEFEVDLNIMARFPFLDHGEYLANAATQRV